MLDRRDFLKAGMIGAGALFVNAPAVFGKNQFDSQRPEKKLRCFYSEAVESKIREVKAKISDKELAWMFENCYPNTLDTTVDYSEENGMPDTFVITGDIHAMWLRDSTAQVWPYLELVNSDEKLKNLIRGVIFRQTKSILFDPYANAFNKTPTGSYWESDITDMKPELHERKWEIDSLCYPVRLAYHYWKLTGDVTVFTQDWKKAAELIIRTFKEQQRKDGYGPYTFMRETSKAEDTVPLYGLGNPVRPVGLICSIFRPSDDAAIFPFLIPSNHFAVSILQYIAEIMEKVFQDENLKSEAILLKDEVKNAIDQYSIFEHQEFGKIYAYEVDGFGGRVFMDDANVPSLLGMPFLDLCSEDDEIYQNTRKFVLSPQNPYFFQGTAGEGIGGPHVGMDYIWPMSIIMRAMTSKDSGEIAFCLKMLKSTHGGTGFMHETFHKNNAEKFTRKWFAWANTLFGQLIVKISQTNPDLLK